MSPVVLVTPGDVGYGTHHRVTTLTVSEITAVPAGMVGAVATSWEADVASVKLPETTEAETRLRPAGMTSVTVTLAAVLGRNWLCSPGRSWQWHLPQGSLFCAAMARSRPWIWVGGC